jgi:hypothetical protein
MQETIDGIIYVYNKLLSIGINPISIILVVFGTHLLKNNLPVIYESKFKTEWIFLTALVLGCCINIPFLFTDKLFTIWVYVINCIIGFFVSIGSTPIMDSIGKIFNRFFGDKNA